jgi:ribonucleotide monophosphatase NagD (HAD superfamily)
MNMSTCNAIFFDLSGVLYEGANPINGAAETIQVARNKRLTLRFVTNTANQNSEQITANLRRMQINIDAKELFTAPLAAKQLIQNKGWAPYCLIHKNIRGDFADIR